MAATLADTLREATEKLASVSDTPRLDGEILLSHALGLSHSALLTRLRDSMDIPPIFQEYLQQRLEHTPIAYILGSWEFFSMQFRVEAPLLVPRPETEHLVECALDFLGEAGGAVLDLCTGTGCVALTIAQNAPGVKISALDIHPKAIEISKANAAAHGIDLKVYQGDLFEALPQDTPRFRLITANPPYVEDGDWKGLDPVITRHEDPGALLSGADGLDCIRRIIQETPQYLQPGGMLAIEMGYRQGQAVGELLEGQDFKEIRILQDLGGRDRIACAILPG